MGGVGTLLCPCSQVDELLRKELPESEGMDGVILAVAPQSWNKDPDPYYRLRDEDWQRLVL